MKGARAKASNDIADRAEEKRMRSKGEVRMREWNIERVREKIR